MRPARAGSQRREGPLRPPQAARRQGPEAAAAHIRGPGVTTTPVGRARLGLPSWRSDLHSDAAPPSGGAPVTGRAADARTLRRPLAGTGPPGAPRPPPRGGARAARDRTDRADRARRAGDRGRVGAVPHG